MPASAILLFELGRVTKYFHSVVVKRVVFRQIDDVKSYLMICLFVSYSKEVPLCVTICIYVVLQYQIVFVAADLHGSKQVSRFKP